MKNFLKENRSVLWLELVTKLEFLFLRLSYVFLYKFMEYKCSFVTFV